MRNPVSNKVGSLLGVTSEVAPLASTSMHTHAQPHVYVHQPSGAPKPLSGTPAWVWPQGSQAHTVYQNSLWALPCHLQKMFTEQRKGGGEGVSTRRERVRVGTFLSDSWDYWLPICDYSLGYLFTFSDYPPSSLAVHSSGWFTADSGTQALPRRCQLELLGCQRCCVLPWEQFRHQHSRSSPGVVQSVGSHLFANRNNPQALHFIPSTQQYVEPVWGHQLSPPAPSLSE